MGKKYPPSIHVKMPQSMRAHLDKRCKALNKDMDGVGQQWDHSKYIRWLVYQDMEAINQPTTVHVIPTQQSPAVHETHIQHPHHDHVSNKDSFYTDLLNLTKEGV